MATFSDPDLQQRIRDLGSTLGDTIAQELGTFWLDKIETIRLAGRSSALGEQQATEQLKNLFFFIPLSIPKSRSLMMTAY